MHWFVTSLRENPELAIFLTLALGFVIGRVRIGSFRLGNVVGTLLAGVLVGQLDVKVDPLVKTVFFALFLFATGYKVGPQFFRGLKKNAASQALLTLVLCVVSLVTTVVAAKVMGYDCGTAAGLLAGAFTESTVIGTAGNTISRLGLPEAETTRLLNNIPVAYAVSYLVGTSFVVWFLSSLAPRLLRVDLKEESRKLEAQSGSKEETGTRSAYREWDVRSFRIPAAWAGRRVADVEGSFAPARVFLGRVQAGGRHPRRLPGHCPAARRRGGGRGAPARAPRRGASLRGGDRGPRAARRPDGGARRGRDAEGARRAVARGDRRGARPRRRPPQARPRGRGDSVRAGHGHQSWRPPPARGGRAGRRAGREGARLRRAAVERDGRGVRGPRDPPRRALRRPHPPGGGSPDQPHRERRGAHHGARVRLAALGAPHLRAHPGARPVDLRHDRPRRLHRLRGPRRRARASWPACARPGRASSS